MRILCFLTLCLLMGCSSPAGPPPYIPVPVKGRVVQNGQPVAVPSGERLVLTFHADQGAVPPGLMFTADAASDGAFEVKPPEKRGIPPGRYRIAVAQRDARGRDKLQGAFSAASTPFIYEVSASASELILDLARRKQ